MITAYCLAEFGGDPYYNMAVDEWLLETVSKRPQAIVIRSYTWQPATITFGLNQRIDRALDFRAVGSTPVIRRVTGGRALIHDTSELTYSITGDLRELEQCDLSGSLTQTSRRISEALVHFLTTVGRDVKLVSVSDHHPSPSTQLHTAPCFESSSRYEIVSESGKIVASAQRRIGTTFLQHGAIKLKGYSVHPALDGIEAQSGTTIETQFVGREEFSQYTEVLFKELCDYFRVERKELVLSPDDMKQVMRRRQLVKKDSSKRRVIKQMATLKSL